MKQSCNTTYTLNFQYSVRNSDLCKAIAKAKVVTTTIYIYMNDKGAHK